MEVADVTVREATAGDLGRIAALISMGALGSSVERPEELAPYVAAFEEISSSSSTVLVAELGRIVVGTLQLIVFRHLQHNGGLCAELESVHVDPELRSHGIGGVLVEAAVERARALGCYRVQLTSNEQRPDAHRFYERHGFVMSHRGFKRMLSD